jgi:hypothetical protein
MSDFNVRSDSVDVEQIMKQIRARIQEKRGVDYTEDQVRELATVRLEKFLDPKNLRSDLLEQFRKSRPPLPDPLPQDPPTPEPPYTFDAETLYKSHRAPLRLIRRLLAPILKLFFNPNTLVQILHTQSLFNLDVLKRDLRRRSEAEQGLHEFDRSRAEWNLLYYEVLHNLVLETTRNAIEVKNLRMRVEALASRLDFSERRVRALEGVVQYRPEAVRQRGPHAAGRPERIDGRDRAPRADGEGAEIAADPASAAENGSAGPAGTQTPGAAVEPGRRRRRRRRGRRGTGAPVTAPGADIQSNGAAAAEDDFAEAEGDELETAVDANGGLDESGDAPQIRHGIDRAVETAGGTDLPVLEHPTENTDEADDTDGGPDPDRQ